MDKLIKSRTKSWSDRTKSLRTFLQAALSSGRSYGAFATTGLSSVANFVISICIARSGTIDEVAQFAIGFAAFMSISGLTNSLISEPSSARLLPERNLRLAGKQVSAYGLCFSAPILIVGAVMGQNYLVAVGIFGHAISTYSYSRFLSTVFGKPLIAVSQEVIKTLGVIVLVFIPDFSNQPFLLFLAWLLLTAIVGYAGALLQRITLVPSFTQPQIPPKESASYAMDFVLGSGTTQMTTFTLGAMAQPDVNASIRGTGTLLGPITMIATSIRTLIIPFLSRRLRHSNDLAPAQNVTLSLLLATLPLVVLVNFLPTSWGEALLGDTWQLTKVVLPILSIEVISTMLTNVPFAGHRSLGAHKRTTIIRTILAAVRLITIVTAAVVGGYVWAAYAMVFTSVIGMITWWVSYRSLMKNVSRKDHNSNKIA